MNARTGGDKINPAAQVRRHEHAHDGLAQGRLMIQSVLLSGGPVKCEQIVLLFF